MNGEGRGVYEEDRVGAGAPRNMKGGGVWPMKEYGF